jgi:hypothetical protein
MSTPQLQSLTTAELLQMLGEREVIAYQQRVLIAQQAARIAELESDDTEP